MKKIYLLALFALSLFAGPETAAQGIYQYWGINNAGGTDNQGTLYTTRMDGAGLKVRPAFTVTNPGGPAFGVQGTVYNNKFYSVAGGGLNADGIIISYDPVTNTYEKHADLYTIGAEADVTNLLLYNNKMYGVYGGYYPLGDPGCIYEFDPATNALTKKFTFPASGFGGPSAGLLLWNGKFWGCTIDGPNSNGGIYSWDPVSNVFTEHKELGGFLGGLPNSILVPYNNKLYGTCRVGGANGDGVLFEFNPATDVYTVRAAFSGGNNGVHPMGGLTLFNNKLYGQTAEEGANGVGTLFEFDPVNNTFATKLQYTEEQGNTNKFGFTVYNNKLYTTGRVGGVNNRGCILEYTPGANTIVTKFSCAYATGQTPSCVMTVLNDRMYGLADGGVQPALDNGLLFEYNPAANTMSAKVILGYNNGKSPQGSVAYLNGKVYGVTIGGGAYNDGVLWEYDMATHTYAIRHHFNSMSPYYNQGIIAYNGKLYGTTENGGTNDQGTLYSYDPINNIFTILHSFELSEDGGGPRGRLLVYNSKLYGTCYGGGNNLGTGTIWEYTPASNNFALKVIFSESLGKFPIAGLCLMNNKMYGVCVQGGANDLGTIYEYNPAINGITKKFDFSNATGTYSFGGLTAVNNKLYGTTSTSGNYLYEFDPANNNYIIRANIHADAGGAESRTTLVYNDETQKLYGVSWLGGAFHSGILFEYDVPNMSISKRTDFSPYVGEDPQHMKLEKIPALVAPGDPGNCAMATSENIDASNNNKWLPFINSNGDAVAEINANGNNLGRVRVNFYVHDGATRQKNGSYYLDRNITITVDNQPATPVSVRLYVRRTEFEKLKNTPGSGINGIGALSVFKNDDACSNTMSASANKLTTNVSTWGGDYVFTTSVNSFSTFYFASSSAVLPVDLLSFTGEKQAIANKLKWTASCTNDVDFSIERSVDGTNFQQIALVMATQQDCGNPFTVLDQHPPVKAYYRLKMTEQNGPVKYSNIILLNRDGKDNFTVSIFPNPVVGSHANLQINTTKKMSIPFTISDAMGRIVMQREVIVQAGTNSYPVPVATLPAGVYQLTYNDGEKNNTVRFVKQ
jgi:uncharacterized repeat protein (TIGR03803 family)